MRVRRLLPGSDIDITCIAEICHALLTFVCLGIGRSILATGCFWHRHEGCRRSANPKTRASYREEKFHNSLLRYRKSLTALQDQGCDVLAIWECETTDSEGLSVRHRAFLGAREVLDDEPDGLGT